MLIAFSKYIMVCSFYSWVTILINYKINSILTNFSHAYFPTNQCLNSFNTKHFPAIYCFRLNNLIHYHEFYFMHCDSNLTVVVQGNGIFVRSCTEEISLLAKMLSLKSLWHFSPHSDHHCFYSLPVCYLQLLAYMKSIFVV